MLRVYSVVIKRAVISKCGKYRYALWRTWDEDLPKVLFIGLNPSTADAEVDDPTLRRCEGFARAWGYGELMMGNLFACRSPYPQELKNVSDPVGTQNVKWLIRLCAKADMVVAAWGGTPLANTVARVVATRTPRLYCLGTTRKGCPRHPLYVPRDTSPAPFTVV